MRFAFSLATGRRTRLSILKLPSNVRSMATNRSTPPEGVTVRIEDPRITFASLWGTLHEGLSQPQRFSQYSVNKVSLEHNVKLDDGSQAMYREIEHGDGKIQRDYIYERYDEEKETGETIVAELDEDCNPTGNQIVHVLGREPDPTAAGTEGGGGVTPLDSQKEQASFVRRSQFAAQTVEPMFVRYQKRKDDVPVEWEVALLFFVVLGSMKECC
mmetsp:Transcript_7284/g.10172  ORF Transcript_7284/g.10172 Transcript_7284/m.10172 type:complete len:214 (-) Transcript_7284:660-1301(-)